MQFCGKDYKFTDCRTGDYLQSSNRGNPQSDSGCNGVTNSANKCNTIFYAQGINIGKKIEELKDSLIQESKKINTEKDKVPRGVEEKYSFEKKGFDLSGSRGQGNLEGIDSFRKPELGYTGVSVGGSNLFGGDGNDGGYSDTGSC
jgi:hypothetical protein